MPTGTRKRFANSACDRPRAVRVLLLPGDLRDAAHCRTLVERTVAELGGLDILVNNAAAQVVNEELDDVTPEDLEGSFRANVFAMLYLAQAAVPHMKPGSAIVNSTSQQAKIADKTMLVYAATKGAIASLTIGLSNLLTPPGHPGELRRARPGLDPDPAHREEPGATRIPRRRHAAGPCRPAGGTRPRLRAAGLAGGQLHDRGAGAGHGWDADVLRAGAARVAAKEQHG